MGPANPRSDSFWQGRSCLRHLPSQTELDEITGIIVEARLNHRFAPRLSRTSQDTELGLRDGGDHGGQQRLAWPGVGWKVGAASEEIRRVEKCRIGVSCGTVVRNVNFPSAWAPTYQTGALPTSKTKSRLRRSPSILADLDAKLVKGARPWPSCRGIRERGNLHRSLLRRPGRSPRCRLLGNRHDPGRLRLTWFMHEDLPWPSFPVAASKWHHVPYEFTDTGYIFSAVSTTQQKTTCPWGT